MSNGKILTAGCSHTRDFMTNPWPSFINNTFNIGIRGAGSDFVSKRVIKELSHNQYEYCVVLWPSVLRVDLFIDNEQQKSKVLEISPWQKNQKRTLYDLNGNNVDINGYYCSGHIRGYLKNYYKNFYSEKQNQINFWFYLLSVQTFCQLQDIKYLFLTVDHVSTYGQSPFEKVNHDKIESDNGEGFYEYLQNQGISPGQDGYHYDNIGHEKYAEFVKQKLNKHYGYKL